jgi:hypothetical protein
MCDADLDEHSIMLRGSEVRYSIYSSRRTERLGIIMDEYGGVRVRAPPGTSPKTIERFLTENSNWIFRTREKMKNRRRRVIDAKDGAFVPYFGMEIMLEISSKVSEPELRGVKGKEILILPANSETGETPFDFLRSFYMQATVSYLHRKIPGFERLTGMMPKRYEVKEFRSKWGSCSPSGTIRFNSKLSAFPEDVIDYVIVHELCHLKYRRHDASFWRLVSSHLGDFDDRREKLRKIAIETSF